MKQLQTLETERLILRSFTLDDAAVVTELAGAYEIAYNTLLIPHPYKEEMARNWISTHQPELEADHTLTYAITHKQEGYLIGAIGLNIERVKDPAEIGYWIGTPYWNKGYCTEAAQAVVQYGFDRLHLHQIYATHFARNQASAKVMQKLGMKFICRLPQWVKKWDEYIDLDLYTILRDEYREARR
ncbi:MAG: GNAT family N-acetyltransferase [Candidatus Zixiibacteriota bacterium]